MGGVKTKHADLAHSGTEAQAKHFLKKKKALKVAKKVKQFTYFLMLHEKERVLLLHATLLTVLTFLPFAYSAYASFGLKLNLICKLNINCCMITV